MASPGVRVELNCSICQDIYTKPVTLSCGHSFCLVCIEKTWNCQEAEFMEKPSCPECRERFTRRPELKRNLRLGNIAESFLLSRDSTCSVHKETLQFYCAQDGVLTCASCCLVGDHRGHRVESLDVASKRKIETLRNILRKLIPVSEDTEREVRNLEELRREMKEKAATETKRVTAMFGDIREQLEIQEKRVLGEISRKQKELSLRITETVHQLEIKKGELSRKIRHIQELCNMADPLKVLKEQEWGGGEFEGDEEGDAQVPDVGDLDVSAIAEKTIGGFSSFAAFLSERIYGQKSGDLSLDGKSRGSYVTVSGDGKTALYKTQSRPAQTPETFQEYCVLSSQSFISGRHYWEVEGGELGGWWVGVASASVGAESKSSHMAPNRKSWGLYRCYNNIYSVGHGGKVEHLHHRPSNARVRISLDYETGRLSFYELSDPIRHLHTFTATFTEPLHAAFWVWSWGTLGKNVWVRVVS
ncbi:hypothetical protein GDO86_019718 [Hymenochirus boettgeri]|uniref:Uncharacterized protein n=1 Tax=Hymenochirus boettgeri TaxID=247094 RepID=A0A8T2IH14_9PIPI|nr:hypothetical protein GDO86_019718 [Hymenochirus boettgeri]